MKKSNEVNLYPYLTGNLYGYADRDGNILIDPQFDRAGLFYNGLANVAKNNTSYIINQHNQTIPLPQKFSVSQMIPSENNTFVALERNYTNAWRFWEWEFLPDFTIVGSSSRNRLLDIQVGRKKKMIYWIEGEKVLKQIKNTVGKNQHSFNIRTTGENSIWIDDIIYHLNAQGTDYKTKNIEPYKQFGEGLYLQKNGKHFSIVDDKGKKNSSKKLKAISRLNLDVELKKTAIDIQRTSPTMHTIGSFYQDQHGNIYLYPDFNTIFPKSISRYTSDSISATDILKQAQQVIAIRQSDRFLFVLNFGKTVFVLNSNGQWETPEGNEDLVHVTYRSGTIIWPLMPHFINDFNLPNGWAVSAIQQHGSDLNTFKVALKKDGQRMEGIWNKKWAVWMVEPQFYYLSAPIGDTDFIYFQEVKEGQWGFYNLKKNTIHIPPIYRSIDKGGWVTDSEKNYKRFYLDIESKREFRDNKE